MVFVISPNHIFCELFNFSDSCVEKSASLIYNITSRICALRLVFLKGRCIVATYKNMTPEELQKELIQVQAAMDDWKAKALKLNMARGKPGKEQLDMVSDILTVLDNDALCQTDGIDARNYGELCGIPAARKLWADILGCKPEETLVGGSSSLNLMYDTISRAFSHGLLHSEKPWGKLDKVKFLCPVPGYDRHFRITEFFGAEMINVPMTAEGPDMDTVEELVKDEAVKGIWCVPKYSNPDGIIYSDKVISRLASMKTAAPDFLIMWDNAYCVHEFDGPYVPFPDIIAACREAGNPDRVVEFASTSKLTFPGAGISVLATSTDNLNYLQKQFGVQMISADKINQLRHVLYMKDKAHTLELAAKHGLILRPKFLLVLDRLEKELGSREIGSWSRAKGGYFLSYFAPKGCAKRALQLAEGIGLTMTGAGATYPYGKDPDDSNIRIAPSLPTLQELDKAMDVFCLCVRAAYLEKLLENK